MILIADSGSTKADWKTIHASGEVTDQSTRGFNPFIQNTEAIEAGLMEDFDKSLEKSKAKAVYYYGAGCSDDYRNSIVENALQKIFPNAKITVNHDLLASARALCGTEPGVACILGTGSNSCLYNGIEITDNVKNIGFLVGDEGSGSHIGKELLRGYFYREMPKDILTDFEKSFPEGQRGILDRIYDNPKPNVYLASFSKFLSSHQGHPYIQHLVFKSFDEFVRRHVLKYDGCQNLKINFVGSVAYYFKDILEIVLASYDLELGNIIKKPIDRLVEFHQKIASK
ncbi:MAG: hypothetical protein AB8H03_25955 [Saprospiraceae bacterium]